MMYYLYLLYLEPIINRLFTKYSNNNNNDSKENSNKEKKT